jgi:hypothetical protein
VLPRSGAYAERLAEGRGALFYAPGDEDELTAALQRLLDEPALWSSLRRRLPAPSEFTPSARDQVRAHLALYEEAVTAGPPPDVRAVPQRERVWQYGEEAWGRALQQQTGEELGFE